MRNLFFVFLVLTILVLSNLIAIAQTGRRLVPENTTPNSQFGYSVSLKGNYAVVGAYFSSEAGDRSGSAFVFKRDGTRWVQHAKLMASDAYPDDLFGCAVSISNKYIAVGARNDDDAGRDAGSTYIFRLIDTTWIQDAELTANDATYDDNFGISVCVDGDYVVVGAHHAEPAGAIYIYKRSGVSWIQEAKLIPNDATSSIEFGCSVSISGDYIVVGAKLDDRAANNSGSAYVFKRDVTGWRQEAKLVINDAKENDYLGGAVSISDDRVIVGSRGADLQGGKTGAVYIFKRNGTSWNQEAKLTASDTGENQLFGYSVSVSSDYAVIGAPFTGSTYVFKRNGTIWNERTKLGLGGLSVSIDGNYALIGGAGSAYVYIPLDAPPASPQNLRASAGVNEVTLTWDVNGEPNFLRYRIYGGTSPNPTTKIDSVDGVTNTTKTIKNLTAGTTYYFRITAANNALQESGFSNEVSATPTNEIFTDISTSLPIARLTAFAWGDYDNDGDLDILFTGLTESSAITKIYRNDAGTFVDFIVPAQAISEGSVAWGDYDNDGDLDILLTGNNGTLENPSPVSLVYRNEWGSFADIGASLTGVFRSSVDWGDYDNDGDLDILLTGDSKAGFISKIYRNDDGVFVDIADPILFGVRGSAVAWGDYDNDGDLDILLTGSGFISKIYRNDNGSFTDIAAPLVGIGAGSVAWGDYDSDGDLDILMSGYSSGEIFKIYRNDKGSFVDVTGPLNNTIWGKALWGDYDNDGDLDILLIGAHINGTQYSKIYRNDGGNFIDIAAPLLGVRDGFAAWGDYDNDGDLDILLTGERFGGGFVIKLYRNDIGTINTIPTPPSNLISSVAGNTVTLSWNKSTDNETAQNGLTYNLRVGTTLGGSEIVSPMADVTTGYRKIPALGNTNHNTRWTIKNLPAGKYYWSVQAIDNAFAGSPFAGEQSFVIGGIDQTPPAAPQGLAAIAGDRQITLKWRQNTEADFLRYRIYRGTSPHPTTKVDSTNNITDTTKTFTGLTNGTTYYFRITAVDKNLNESGYSNEVSATPSVADLPPAPPQNLAATAGVAQITLTWNANTEPDFLRYRIYGGTSANPTTKIDSVEGANNTTKTLTNLTVGAIYYFRLTAVDQALHASGYSNTVTAKPLADNTAPALVNAVYSEPANLNSEVPVAIAATDASGIKNVWLYYRAGGAASFSSKPMLLQSGSTYRQTIPAAAVTNRGVEFYVRAEDTYGNVAQTGLHPIRVYCPNGIANPAFQPSGKEASFYRLFSIPLALDDKSPAMFLTANSSLGAYDNVKYRWYGLERATQALREYPNFGNIQMTPDMGFALLVNIKNVKLKTSSGTTVNTTVAYNITLPAGWSLIGNPFNFNIPFDSLRVSKGTFELWSFEGDWQINTRGLEPWKGYAIWLSEAATFSIRPGVAALNTGTALYSVANNDAENWLLQISADNGRSASRFNFAGQYAGATDDEDALDLHQPVRLADGIEVVFTKKNSARLKADIRQPSSKGHTWEFTCRLNPEDEVLSLTFDGVATVPQAFDIFLLEPETATAYDLRANSRLQFATRHLTEKRFQLVAGTKAYLSEQSLQAELHPSSFELLQNFPNPFWSGATSRSAGNPSTQIIYSLPEASHVEVSIHNIRGERVATLVNERQESGSHTVVWNAERVGSGVYFIKMRAGRVEMIRKCLFVK